MMEENFVERKPERGAKFLATVGIKCITASIKQHGFGIIKSAVNIAHELLEKVRVLGVLPMQLLSRIN